MDYVIITNNPLILQTYREEEVIYVDSYSEVLITTRDYIHQGANLLSHPQAGSIKPYETPYRTIIVSNIQGALDIKSLHYIEAAIERFATLSKSMGSRTYDESCAADFQVIDAGLVDSAMKSLNK